MSENNFDRDLQQEIFPTQYLQHYFFPYLEKIYGANIEIIQDIERQLEGIDLILNYNTSSKINYIDIKTQLNNYIANPTPTFCLELSYIKDNVIKDGWLLKENLKTTMWMLGWIHESNYILISKNKQLTNFNDIKNLEIMCIEKQKTLNYLNDLGLTNQKLKEINDYIRTNHISKCFYDYTIGEFVSNKTLNTFTFTCSYFLPEQCINLVIPKYIWEKLCSAHYFIKQDKIKILKENNKLMEKMYYS